MKSLFLKYSEVPWVEFLPGVRVKPIIVDRLGASLIEIDAGVVTPLHDHIDEEIGLCLKGRMEVRVIDDSGERMESAVAGTAFALRPYVKHSIEALEDSLLMGTWSPADRMRKGATVVAQDE